MEEKLDKIISLLERNQKDEYEQLTKEQVMEEFGIGEPKVNMMFRDPELEVQRYKRPFTVSRIAVKRYMTKSHDYLCKNGG